MQRRRGNPFDVKVSDLIPLLGKAGWQARRGMGSHTVFTKEGQNSFSLSDPVSRNQWTSVEHTIGVAVRSLLTPARKGRGATLSYNNLYERVQLARELYKAGFEGSFIIRHCGLSSVYAKSPEFRLSLLDTWPVHRIVASLMGGSVTPESPAPSQAAPAASTPEPEPEPEPVTAHETDTTMLELMADLESSIKDLVHITRGAYDTGKLEGTLAGIRSEIAVTLGGLSTATESLTRITRMLEE